MSKPTSQELMRQILDGGFVTEDGKVVTAQEYLEDDGADGRLNSEVDVIRGSGAKRIRYGDEGVIVAENPLEVCILVYRTNRFAWVSNLDVEVTRFGIYRAKDVKGRKGE